MTASQSVFDKQGHLLRKIERHLVGQICSLAEVDEVFQGEGERNWFREGNGNVLLGLFNVGVLTDGHCAAANVTLAGELDAFLGSLDDDYVESASSRERENT